MMGLIHDATTSNEVPSAQKKSVQRSSEELPPVSASSAMPRESPARSRAASSKIERPERPSSTEVSNATAGLSTIKPVAGIGMCTDLWLKPGNALLGPCARACLRLSRLWRLAATGGVQWAAVQTDSIAIRSWHAGLDVRFGRTYWLALGTELSAIRLAPSGDTSPSERSVCDPVFSLRAGMSKPLVRHLFGVGAGLEVYPEYHDVKVDHDTPFGLPLVALTVDLAYEFGP